MRGPRPPARRAARRAPGPGGPRRRPPRGPRAPHRSSPRRDRRRRSRARPARARAHTTVHRERSEGRREPAAQGRRGDDIDGVGSPTTLRSAAWTATRSAKDPGPVKPGWVCRGQTWDSPAAQYSQAPQPHTNGTVTRSPTRHRVTSGPAAATTPANSCPGTWGRATSCPFHACQSDRHTPSPRPRRRRRRRGRAARRPRPPRAGTRTGRRPRRARDIIGPAGPWHRPGPVRC